VWTRPIPVQRITDPCFFVDLVLQRCINFTAVADRDTCPDVEVFSQSVRSALDELARSVLVPAS
jgi:hypothetical protein